MQKTGLEGVVVCLLGLLSGAQAETLVLAPDRVFDGERMHAGWRVRVEGGIIAAAGPVVDESDAAILPLPGMTLTPGLIDLHTHVLLHPYDETSWNDQVLRESVAERALRASQHLRATLLAGFTTIRDLGTEGAGYADVGLKDALAKGVIDGPRLIVAGPAIVAEGSYGPKGFHEGVDVPQGAIEAGGHDNLVAETRRQIGGGADLVKVYADYGWGPNGDARPTFSEAELRLIVETAAASGRPTVAHAASAEGARRAIAAGVVTIEHGDEISDQTLRAMASRGTGLCPTLAAVDAVSRYAGWDGSIAAEPERIKTKRDQIRRARKAGAPICLGSDAGVFAHGENGRELELLVDYGATPMEALRAATSVNARLLGLGGEIGRIAPGLAADLAAFEGDPSADIAAIRRPRFVMQAGSVKLRP